MPSHLENTNIQPCLDALGLKYPLAVEFSGVQRPVTLPETERSSPRTHRSTRNKILCQVLALYGWHFGLGVTLNH